ncbi:MAG: hypothetical protein RL284_438, partial [Bacteroidota bacterium]
MGSQILTRIPVTVDEKINYSDILNLIATIVVSLIIGYYLNKQFENDKVIKALLLDDLEKISRDIGEIQSFCNSLKGKSALSEDDRCELNSILNRAEKKMTSFLEFLEMANKDLHKSTEQDLISNFNSFNRKLTGDGYYD